MPGLTVSAHAWGDYSGERFVVFNTEKRSQMCEIHLYEAALVAQQVGNAYFYRLTEIKELSGSLWWMHEGILKPIAGCGLFSHVDLTGVARH